MAETSTLAREPIGRPDHPSPGVAAVEMSPTADELDILNDDVPIEVVPGRPCGTIRVKLVCAGRSTPIVAEDPRTE